MKARCKELLFEAYRRNENADMAERSKPILKRWLGLGTLSAYRPAIEDGLMVWHNGITPPARCMGWLVLTDVGLRAMQELSDEFALALDGLKQNPYYQRSILSQYMLAGGLTD